MATTEKMIYDDAALCWERGMDNVLAFQRDFRGTAAEYEVARVQIIWEHIKHTGWTEEELDAENLRRVDILLAKQGLK